YDEYRVLLADQAAQQDWHLLDLWDAMPEVGCYTDSPVHLTPECSARLGVLVGDAITAMADHRTLP
ncbi:MAG: hypothetical protein JXA10_06675, partial [Anaerolineae bacterium]|nr:hypothetical protein [Anaerolineae bacterium]